MAKDDEDERKDGAGIVQPSVRTYRLWTPAQLRTAEASADQGYLRHAVDLCDWILADDKVRGSLDGRINGMLGAPVSFEPAGSKRKQKAPVKALEAGEDYWSIFVESEVKQTLKWAIILGLGPAFLKWGRPKGHDDRDIPVLTFFHPQPLRYDWQRRTWLRQLERGGEEPITFGDGVWVGHMPEGNYRPWSLGLWRGLARWCLLKAFAISDYGRLGEAVVKNVVEIDKEVESTIEKRRELSKDISGMTRDGSIVLPPGYHYKLVEASAATKDLFDKQIGLADNAIAIAIRGGNLTTDVKGGSRAAAQVQERTGDDANKLADASAWTDTEHDEVLAPWAGSNFGDPMLAPWPTHKVQKPEDKKAKAETMTAALDGAQKAGDLGMTLDQKAFTEEFGLDGFLKPGTKSKPRPVPGADPTDDDNEDDQDEEDDEDDEDENAEASARARHRRRLASGFAKNAAGFIEGQLYADALVERGAEAALAELGVTLDAIEEELDAATSYDDLRERLRTRYAELSPEQISELLYRHAFAGELAGYAAVRQDTPELP